MSNCESWAQTLAPILAHQRQIALRETWGHLAPAKNVSYKYKMIFTVSEYDSGTIDIIQFRSEDDNLPDSPWLYDSMHAYVRSLVEHKTPCGVYLLEGTFRNFRWWGRPKFLIDIDNVYLDKNGKIIQH